MVDKGKYIGLDNEQNAVENFDFDKLLFILQRSVLWILIFLVTSVSIAYLVIRYTKPVYESSAVVKLHFENDANILGLVADDQLQRSLSDISGEIELLKSKLFLHRVAKALNYPVAYYAYGTYLVDERYDNSPIEVSFKIHNPIYYDRNFDITLRDDKEFQLSYVKNGKTISEQFAYDEPIQTEDFNLLIEKTKKFPSDPSGKYFFIINSDEAIVSFLEQNMSIAPENLNASTIRIGLEDFNKYKARNFVRIISELYLDYTTEKKNQTIIQKIQFLDEQIEDAETKLQEFDEYFENFTIENKTVSLQQDMSKTIEMLNALDTQRFSLNQKVRAIKLIVDQLETTETISLNPVLLEQFPKYISQAVVDYQSLLEERQLKLNSYNEKTSVISRIDDQLTITRSEVISLIQEYNNSLTDQLSSISTQRKYLESNFVQLPSMGTQYNKTRRLYQQREEFLVALRQSKMELEITKAGTVTEFVILSPAAIGVVPIKPQKMMIYGIGVVAGIVISVFFVLIRYLLHNKFTSVKEVERRTDIPIIGAIPSYRKEKLEHSKLVVGDNPRSPLAEALRSIRTNMEFLQPSEGARVISITSTVSGEGKTFMAVNFGAVMALSGKKVCLVDIDMRKPKVHVALGQPPSEDGVSTILINKAKVKNAIQDTENENLYYIGAGPTPPNPSELLLSNAFDLMLDKLKQEFDVIILDTPPVGLVTDGVLVMRKSDLQFYMLKSDYSRRAFLSTIENVRMVNKFNRMALVFNGNGKHSTYNYGYGTGYGYGAGYYEEERSPIVSSMRSFF